MVKRKDLKQKLKAASRRRKQRVAVAANSGATGNRLAQSESSGSVAGSPSSNASVDVMGLIIQAIVHHTNQAQDKSDAMIVAALRSNLKGAQPTGESAKRLNSVLVEISKRDDVKVSAFRKAIDGLLNSAAEHHEAKQANAFGKYLRMIVS